jgi:hypothetical protein
MAISSIIFFFERSLHASLPQVKRTGWAITPRNRHSVSLMRNILNPTLQLPLTEKISSSNTLFKKTQQPPPNSSPQAAAHNPLSF